ncbi:DNA cytosine methyltransferase [Chloroflexus sp.]|uniref:DNA cytosine methyltransferase n=1 Tax=Chloroflexus sp. TaxID=1904827 RepID=UPI002ACD54F2|nr:DNA cytosine methyltransferase [Chloroflexus sp.]
MDKTITFIDLFAGIGGIRLAFERAGATCIFSSEWDKMACRTYEANFVKDLLAILRKYRQNDATSMSRDPKQRYCM